MLNRLDYLPTAGAVNVFAGHTNQLPIGSQTPITHV